MKETEPTLPIKSKSSLSVFLSFLKVGTTKKANKHMLYLRI